MNFDEAISQCAIIAVLRVRTLYETSLLSWKLTRRKRAAVSYIWPVVRNLAKWEIGEAAAAARWVFELDPGFAPQERGSILLGYKMLGFAATERLVRVQASLRRRSGADPA